MPLTTLQLRIARTDLAAGTALTIDTHYRVALTAIRTLTFTGTPAEGSKTSLVIYSDGAYTLTIPDSKRYGGADSVITSLAIPAGLSGLSWEYINGGWVVADSLSSSDFIPTSYLDVDDTLAANSDVKVPSQQAVKAYVDGQVKAFSNVAVSATTKTLALADADTYQDCTHADGCTITVPPNSAVAFPVGTEITGAGTLGAVTLAAGDGVTISRHSSDGLATDGALAPFGLKKLATNTWILTGRLAAA